MPLLHQWYLLVDCGFTSKGDIKNCFLFTALAAVEPGRAESKYESPDQSLLQLQPLFKASDSLYRES